MFQIHHPHCYCSPPKLDHYDDIMSSLHHICNIFIRIIKSAFIEFMKTVIQGEHYEYNGFQYDCQCQSLDVITKSTAIVVLHTTQLLTIEKFKLILCISTCLMQAIQATSSLAIKVNVTNLYSQLMVFIEFHVYSYSYFNSALLMPYTT